MEKVQPFWLTKTLSEMTPQEWESLCDGCGKCCLHKLEDEDSGEVVYTRVACELLDSKSGRCKDYDNRFARVSDCLDLRNLEESNYHWLPATCAYRLVSEGQDLYDWHYLKSGRPGLVHKAVCSVRGRTIPESKADMNNLGAQVIHWIDT